jgi:uncharacterized protein
VTPIEILERYQRAIVDQAADDLADLYSDDAVHEIPFAFPGLPRRYVGREEVRAAYRALWAASPATPQQIRDVRIHTTQDPGVIVVEQTVAGEVGPTGAAFEFPGVLVLTVREGRIVHVRDYLDGLGAVQALGRRG